jgi:hypothetical protein
MMRHLLNYGQMTVGLWASYRHVTILNVSLCRVTIWQCLSPLGNHRVSLAGPSRGKSYGVLRAQSTFAK